MFLRHDPSSLCNTTGALLVVALSAAISSALRGMLFRRKDILDITVPNRDGFANGDLSSKVALHSGASRQPA